LQGIVTPNVLLSPLTTQEAMLSSRIEGTQATLDEVLEHEAGQPMSPEKTQDIREIANYRAALQAGILSLLPKGSGRRPARLSFEALINLAG
jgi:Fic family protein